MFITGKRVRPHKFRGRVAVAPTRRTGKRGKR